MNQKDKIFGEKSNVYLKKMTNDELSNTLMSINCDGQYHGDSHNDNAKQGECQYYEYYFQNQYHTMSRNVESDNDMDLDSTMSVSSESDEEMTIEDEA